MLHGVHADTAANQEAYPATWSTAGLGFRSLDWSPVFDLASGAADDAGRGTLSGKTTGEMALFRQQQRYVQRGDVVLADCYYSSYTGPWWGAWTGDDYVGRQHHRRTRIFAVVSAWAVRITSCMA